MPDGRFWVYDSPGGWWLGAWDGAGLAPVGPTIDDVESDAAFLADVDDDGVRDLLSVTDDTLAAWSGRDGAALGTQVAPVLYPAISMSLDGLAALGGPSCTRVGMPVGAALYRWDPAAWVGDGGRIEAAAFVVDGESTLSELIGIGDRDGDGLEDAVWLPLYETGEVCLIEGAWLDGSVHDRAGMRCLAGGVDDPDHGDLDGDGYEDLLVRLTPSDAQPEGAVLVYRGGPEDCDCDDDGTLSSVCGGADGLDQDPTRNAAVREVPGSGDDEDGDGLVDETPATTGQLAENAWTLYDPVVPMVPAWGVLLPDSDGDLIPEPIVLARDDGRGVAHLIGDASASLGPGREVALPEEASLTDDPVELGRWGDGVVAREGEWLVVWTPVAGRMERLATAYGGSWDWAVPEGGGDVDGDGEPELVAVYGYARFGDARLFLGSALRGGGEQVGQDLELMPTMNGAGAARFGDLDGDGLDEVLVLQAERDGHGVATAAGIRVLSPVADPTVEAGWLLPETYVSLFRPTDGDGDGYVDVVLRGATGTAPRAIDVVRGGALPGRYVDWQSAVALEVEDRGYGLGGNAEAGIAVFEQEREDLLCVLPLSGSGHFTWEDSGGWTLAVPSPTIADLRDEAGTLWILASAGMVPTGNPATWGVLFGPGE